LSDLSPDKILPLLMQISDRLARIEERQISDHASHVHIRAEAEKVRVIAENNRQHIQRVEGGLAFARGGAVFASFISAVIGVVAYFRL
jgi:hypothetical protein